MKPAAARSTARVEAPSIVRDALSEPGRPLDLQTRAGFEARFGCDFSRVRVHTGRRAAESAASIGVSAYTVGSHVIFWNWAMGAGDDRRSKADRARVRPCGAANLRPYERHADRRPNAPPAARRSEGRRRTAGGECPAGQRDACAAAGGRRFATGSSDRRRSARLRARRGTVAFCLQLRSLRAKRLVATGRVRRECNLRLSQDARRPHLQLCSQVSAGPAGGNALLHQSCSRRRARRAGRAANTRARSLRRVRSNGIDAENLSGSCRRVSDLLLSIGTSSLPSMGRRHNGSDSGMRYCSSDNQLFRILPWNAGRLVVQDPAGHSEPGERRVKERAQQCLPRRSPSRRARAPKVGPVGRSPRGRCSPVVHQVLRQGGRPLNAGVHAYFERGLGSRSRRGPRPHGRAGQSLGACRRRGRFFRRFASCFPGRPLCAVATRGTPTSGARAGACRAIAADSAGRRRAPRRPLVCARRETSQHDGRAPRRRRTRRCSEAGPRAGAAPANARRRSRRKP